MKKKFRPNRYRPEKSAPSASGIRLSGRVFLREEVENDPEFTPEKGDAWMYIYEPAGVPGGRSSYIPAAAGYFKVEVFEGRRWFLLAADAVFSEKEHHFSRGTLPFDTFELCAERIVQHAGKMLARTYREHYEIMLEDEFSSDTPEAE